MATVHDRFQVGDDCCGFVESFQNLNSALEASAFHSERHRRDKEPEIVTVYDLMARRRNVELWDSHGKALAVRL